MTRSPRQPTTVPIGTYLDLLEAQQAYWSELKELLAAGRVAALRALYREVFAEMQLRRADAQVGRWREYSVREVREHARGRLNLIEPEARRAA